MPDERAPRGFKTRVVHAGEAPDPFTGAVGVPIYQNATFAFRSADQIDRFNEEIGRYVAYWAVIAVFVYYYEVVARYVFNSPTNWVHESMFLMFGMQYLLCGAYAYREESHVRVDIFYSRFSPRGKAIADIITSVLFFIFTLTMLVTLCCQVWPSRARLPVTFTSPLPVLAFLPA